MEPYNDERIFTWLSEPVPDSDIGDDLFASDEDENDNVEEREEDSDTEQEIGSDEEEVEDSGQDETHFLGKDKTKWRKNAPPRNVRTRAHNIVTHLPGVKGDARLAKTPLECWKNFFTDDILEIIVRNTNKYIQSVRGNYQRERDAKETTIEEIKAIIGLLYLAGYTRSGRQNIYDLWSTDGTGIEIFRTVMPLSRFKFLLQCLRFDDKSSREDRKKLDNFAPVREIFDKFVGNCKKSYSMSEYATVDEKLEAFRGRCLFRMYIPSKPSKYGIKIYALVDSRMFYTSNLEVYVGKQPDGPFKVSNSPGDVVERLCEPVWGSGRNITIDNWFTSYELAMRMLINHKLTIVGTLKKNKRQIPPSFINTRGRENHSSMFGFQEKCTLMSYIPKQKKNVLLLSTLHNDGKIDESTGEAKKTEVITFYNSTKGGVDVVDEMCATYNCARNTRRWPMVIFYSMLNVAGINSYVVYFGNKNPKLVRREFLKNLSLDLVREHVMTRATSSNIPHGIRERASAFLGTTVQREQPQKGKRGRCKKCVRKNRKSQYYCCKCYAFLCLEHISVMCEGCLNNEESD